MDDNAKIYLDDNGNYHDNTEENRELYPPASTTADLAQEAVPEGEPVPFTDEGKVDTDAITGDVLRSEGGKGADPDGNDGEPSTFEPGTGQPLPDAPNQTEPDAQPPATAKTRKA